MTLYDFNDKPIPGPLSGLFDVVNRMNMLMMAKAFASSPRALGRDLVDSRGNYIASVKIGDTITVHKPSRFVIPKHESGGSL